MNTTDINESWELLVNKHSREMYKLEVLKLLVTNEYHKVYDYRQWLINLDNEKRDSIKSKAFGELNKICSDSDNHLMVKQTIFLENGRTMVVWTCPNCGLGYEVHE